jgi:hypothetical protein
MSISIEITGLAELELTVPKALREMGLYLAPAIDASNCM